MKNSNAVKSAPASTPARAKTLTRIDRQRAEAQRAEEARQKRNAYTRAWRAKRRAKIATPTQASAPAVATTTPSATITKAQLVATLEVQIAAAKANGHAARVEAFEATLGLARLLAG